MSIETWNRRAGFLLQALEHRQDGEPSRLDRARAVLAHWRALVASVDLRALAAAAHQGMEPGPVQRACERHRRGCLTLSGPVGCGKTVGAAWLAYQAEGSVLWLDAVEVGQAHPDQIARWRHQIATTGLVVLDDVGAGSSVGEWSGRKVADILTTILERSGRSVVATNLASFDAVDPRSASRARMRPNVWLSVKGADRRPKAEPPPEIDVLPPRERDAQALVQCRRSLQEAHHAVVMADVDVPSIQRAARALGYEKWSDVDRAAAEREARTEQVMAEIGRLTERLRLGIVPDKPDPDVARKANQAAKRNEVLDLLAFVAEQRGVDEAEILAELGRSRLDLGERDQAALLAMARP